MKQKSKLYISLLICIFSLSNNFGQDYLVTKDNDTIHGIIEWKTNTSVFVRNNEGKYRFKANKTKLFKRGAFVFVSINTGIPEFLLEVKKGKISYYKESHLKSKYTLDYIKHVYLKYNDTIFPINVGNKTANFRGLNSNFQNIERNNIHKNISYKNGDLYRKHYIIDKYSLNFKLCFYHILGTDNQLTDRIENNNYSFEDIDELVDLSNIYISSKDINKFVGEKTPNKFASGSVITKNNDTIYGSIKLDNSFSLKKKIKFISKNGETLTYRPSELSEFVVNKRVYKGIIIDKKKRLLRELIKGKISLYKDVQKRRNYITQDSKQYFLVDRKGSYLKLFKNKPAIYNRIVKNSYKYFEIKSIISLYNED